MKAFTAVIFALLIGMVAIAPNPSEDDTLFNCHLHGNRLCGPASPWHGFVNI